eukprot:s69_g16.t1
MGEESILGPGLMFHTHSTELGGLPSGHQAGPESRDRGLDFNELLSAAGRSVVCLALLRGWDLIPDVQLMPQQMAMPWRQLQMRWANASPLAKRASIIAAKGMAGVSAGVLGLALGLREAKRQLQHDKPFDLWKEASIEAVAPRQFFGRLILPLMAPKQDVPWSDRHKPRHLGEVVGNTDQIRKLAEWLRDWDDVVLRGKKKEIPAPDPKQKFQPPPENLNARAVLVSGPPGIGKTTTCTLVAKCSRFKVMEFNASDARSKAVIDNMTNSLAGNKTLSFGTSSVLQRSAIIMDECDGMTGGDKGGLQALINLIQVTKNPVICICNDRSDQQVRQLANHCLDLRFRRPENSSVAKRIKKIMESEGKKVEIAAVEAIVEACGQDLRQVINHLQFFGSLTGGNQKDTQVMTGTFEACAKLLSHHRERLSIDQRMDLHFVDYDLVPTMVQENYLRPFEKQRMADDTLERAAQASHLIAMADGMSGSFELGGTMALLGTVYPSALMASKDQSFAKPAFPAYLQKRGAISKNERILQELSAKIRHASTCGSREFVTRKMVQQLQKGLTMECAQALHRYGLTREFFTDQVPALRQPLQLEDSYKKIDVQECQNLQQQTVIPKKRRKGQDSQTKRRSFGSQASPTQDASPMEDEDDEIPGLVKKGGKQVKKKIMKEQDLSKCSLKSWQPNKQVTTSQIESKPLLVMKYVEGHTCSVRASSNEVVAKAAAANVRDLCARNQIKEEDFWAAAQRLRPVELQLEELHALQLPKAQLKEKEDQLASKWKDGLVPKEKGYFDPQLLALDRATLFGRRLTSDAQGVDIGVLVPPYLPLFGKGPGPGMPSTSRVAWSKEMLETGEKALESWGCVLLRGLLTADDVKAIRQALGLGPRRAAEVGLWQQQDPNVAMGRYTFGRLHLLLRGSPRYEMDAVAPHASLAPLVHKHFEIQDLAGNPIFLSEAQLVLADP